MGLDMYVYRAKKPELDPDMTYDWDDLIGFRCPTDEVGPAVSQIIPFCQKIHACSTVFDMKKIREDYELSEHAYIAASTREGIYFRDDERSKNQKDIMIPVDTIREKYSKVEKFDAWYCELTEVHYWRKAYQVSDWMNDTIVGGTENCGFYYLSEDMIRDHNDMFPDNPIDAEFSYAEPLFYHEWY